MLPMNRSSRQVSKLETVDLVIDGVGIAATRRAASQLVRPGGVIVHIGLGDANDGLDIRRMTLQEIAFVTYRGLKSPFRRVHPV